MDFPIADLLDDDRSRAWILRHFHSSGGLRCPRCQTSAEEATVYTDEWKGYNQASFREAAQTCQAGCLSLMINAIVVWNTLCAITTRP